MALVRHSFADQDPLRIKFREAMFPYTKPGVERKLATLGKFELFMFICYVVNMVVLALPSGYDDPNSSKTSTLKGFEMFFTILYVVEIFINGVAFGFQDLLHPVRLLDSLLVVANLAILGGYYNGSATWSFSLLPARCSLRILRPFFVTTEFPNVRLFVVSVARSILQLTDVTLLFSFFLLWFGVAGIFQFGGALQTRCVSDFHTFGALPPELAVNFFGPPSSKPWPSTNRNSTLNTIALSTTYSTVIPISVFGTIIQNGNVSEAMVVAAMHSFASSFLQFYGLTQPDLVCGSEFISDGSLAMYLDAALSDDDALLPTQRYKQRPVALRGGKGLNKRNVTVSVSPFNETVSQSTTRSATLESPNIYYEYNDVITKLQLRALMNQAFQLADVVSCSPQQACSKEPAALITGFICPYSYTCLPDVYNPYNGTVNFDNLGMSMLTLFTANTFQLWYEVMWWQIDSSNALSSYFMILEVVIGSFMIIGLVVVVLTVEYDKAKSLEKERIAKELELAKELEEEKKARLEREKRIKQQKAARKRQKKSKDATESQNGSSDEEESDKDEHEANKASHPNGSFSLFSMTLKKPKEKSKIEIAQEKEDEQEALRGKQNAFASLVTAARNRHNSAAIVTVDENTIAPQAAEDNALTIENEAGEDNAKKHSSMFSLGVVSVIKSRFHQKLLARRAAKRAAQGESGDTQDVEMSGSTAASVAVPIKQESSSDSEEEFRKERELQRQKLADETAAKAANGVFDDDSDDGDAVDEVKLKRRAARAILKRKLAAETKPWKVKFRKARFYCKWYIVERSWFMVLYVVFILASTVTACSEHYGMSSQTRRVIDALNILYTVFFILELGARMLADTAVRFFRRKFNVFDVCNVIISVLDSFVAGNFPLLRALRVFRMFKLLDVSSELKKWIYFILDACTASPMLVLMLLLIMFIFSTFGMQLFGGTFCGMNIATEPDPQETVYSIDVLVPSAFGRAANGSLIPIAWRNATETVFLPSSYTTDCPNLPRANFDNFGNALLTSFIIATGDNWNYVMYNAMNSVNYAVAIPFIIYFYVAVYILMNLLVSVLLSAADNDKSITEEALLEQQRAENDAAQKRVDSEDPFAEHNYTEADVEKLLQDGQDDDSDAEVSDASETDEDDEVVDVVISRSGKVKEKSRAAKVVEELSRMWARSRKSLKSLIEHSAWHTLMILNVLVGTVAMGLESPIAAPDANITVQTRKIDLAVNVIFVVEIALYVHVYGMLRKPSSYLRRDGWNIIDFLIVLTSFVCMLVVRNTTSDSTSTTMMWVCFLRSLRPLRVIRRARGMRKVMSAILGSLPEMKNVFIVTLGIFASWGLFGVFFFQGQLRSCFRDGVELSEVDELTCLSIGGEYINSDMNFDNVLYAMLTIFVCATLESWSTQMFRAMDIDAQGQPFRKNANPLAALYFVIAAAFGGLIIMNLFVSVLISSYNEKKRKAAFQRSILLTKEQEAWLTTNKRLSRLLPIRNQKRMADEHNVFVTSSGLIICHTQISTEHPTCVVDKHRGEEIVAKVTHQVGRIRVKIREITRSNTFANLFLAIVLTNFIITAIVHYPQSQSLTNTIQTIQQAFTICFVIEAALKISGETFSVYMNSQWNRLDFLVAVVSLLSMILATFYNAKQLALVQTLRITRLARLTKEYFSLDRMIAKFGAAILSLGHVLGLIIMVFFIYAVIGMKMFGRVKQMPFGSSGNGGASDGIDTHANFENLGNAMLLLARLTTAGDWPVVLVSCSTAFQPPPQFCDLHIGDCGVAAPTAEIYFVTFIFISMVVLVNLFTAVLLDSFGSSGLTRALRKKEAELFFREWKQYDPDDTLTISPYDVLPLIRSFPSECVLGFNSRPRRKRIGLEINFLTSLQLVDLTHRISWVALVDALCRAAYPIPMRPRMSVAYLVYTDLIHQPLQQFAQIGRNMMEITDAAQAFGKNALNNVQRLSRLVSGKKIRRRRGKSRRGRSVKGEVDATKIHQDVMMFLSTQPRDRWFNPFLLPKVYVSALKAIAAHVPDQRLDDFLHIKDVNDDEEGYKPPTLDRESGALANTSFSPKDSLDVVDPLEDPLVSGHAHESLYPASHPVMALLTPTDLSDLFSKCAALVTINAVIKKRRSKLAKRVMEAKIEREIIAKLQDELGIVVPESVLHNRGIKKSIAAAPSGSGRTAGDGTSSGRGDANQRAIEEGANSNAPASPLRRARSQSIAGSHASQAAFNKNLASPAAAVHSDLSSPLLQLDERFTPGFRQPGDGESLPARKRSVFFNSSSPVSGDANIANASVAGGSPADVQDNSSEYQVQWEASGTLRRLPAASKDLLPSPEGLEAIRWNDVGALSVAMIPPVITQEEEIFSCLVPYDSEERLTKLVKSDPVFQASLIDEVSRLVAALSDNRNVMQQWSEAAGALDKIQAPLTAQGMGSLVLCEDITSNLEGAAYRCVCQLQTLVNAVRRVLRSQTDSELKHLLTKNVQPLMTKLPQLSVDVMSRQVDAGKERQNESIQRLVGEYKKLHERANELERSVVSAWPSAAAALMEKDVVSLTRDVAVSCKELVKIGIASVFAGGRLPKTVQQQRGFTTVQVISTTVDPNCLAFRFVHTLRTLELIDALCAKWDNISQVRMVANQKTTLTGSSIKAIQYYYSVTDLAEVGARAGRTVAKSATPPLGFRQAIDKLVVNSIYRSPSATNLDSLTSVLESCLPRFVEDVINQPPPAPAVSNDSVSKASDGSSSSALKRRKSSKSRSGQNVIAQLVAEQEASRQAALATAEQTIVEPVHSKALRHIRESVSKAAAAYAAEEREDPYLTSVFSFLSTLSKSEKMKQDSHIGTEPTPKLRALSVAGAPDADAALRQQRELFSIEEFRKDLEDDLLDLTNQLVCALRFAIETPRLFQKLASVASRSLVKWKVEEISYCCAVTVRQNIVCVARDVLNSSVATLQKQRDLLKAAESETRALNRLSSSQKPLLASALMYVPPQALETERLQELQEAAEIDPREPIFLRDDSGAIVLALNKSLVCPFALQPNERALQHCTDILLALACLGKALRTVDSPQNPFACIAETALQQYAQVTKQLLHCIARNGFGYAPPLSQTVQVLYRNQPGFDNVLDTFSKLSHQLPASITDFHKKFTKFLSATLEVAVSAEREKLAETLSPRRAVVSASLVSAQEAQQSVPTSADAGAMLNNTEGSQSAPDSSGASSTEIDPLATTSTSLLNSILSSDKVVSSPRAEAKAVSNLPKRKEGGTGRTHEQLIADAKSRLELRKRGLPSNHLLSADDRTEHSGPKLVSSLETPLFASQGRGAQASLSSPAGQRDVSSARPPALQFPLPAAPLHQQAPVTLGGGMTALLHDVCRRTAALCRHPRPSLEILTVLQPILTAGLSVRFYRLSGGNPSADKLPRSEFLYYPALLCVSAPPESTTVGDFFATCTVTVSKKAQRSEARAALRLSDIKAIRYPLSIQKDVDCFPSDAKDAAKQEWSEFLPRLVAISATDASSGAGTDVLFVLASSGSVAMLVYQVLDAMRDAATL